jgi:hypothetical protein
VPGLAGSRCDDMTSDRLKKSFGLEEALEP